MKVLAEAMANNRAVIKKVVDDNDETKYKFLLNRDIAIRTQELKSGKRYTFEIMVLPSSTVSNGFVVKQKPGTEPVLLFE